jgi:DNA-binding transcriptional LysR family regulator
MTSADTSAILGSLPSLKSLMVFDVAGRHLNLVRAAEELHVTQSALSRQLKLLEGHLGVALFVRGPRGLSFTQDGEMLFDFTRRGLQALEAGVGRLTLQSRRHTLQVSIARSFAVLSLAERLPRFAAAQPWIDVRVDVHRFHVDLESSGADVSVRLGAGDWPGHDMLPLTDDRICAVCAPGVASIDDAAAAASWPAAVALLYNPERDYRATWQAAGRLPADLQALPAIAFNDSAAMLAAARAGGGVAVTRTCLAAADLARGSLVKAWPEEIGDGLRYWAVASNRTMASRAVAAFMAWLREEHADRRIDPS